MHPTTPPTALTIPPVVPQRNIEIIPLNPPNQHLQKRHYQLTLLNHRCCQLHLLLRAHRQRVHLRRLGNLRKD